MEASLVVVADSLGHKWRTTADIMESWSSFKQEIGTSLNKDIKISFVGVFLRLSILAGVEERIEEIRLEYFWKERYHLEAWKQEVFQMRLHLKMSLCQY